MKKLSKLLFLITVVVFIGCEQEQLIQKDLNLVQKEQVATQEHLTGKDVSRTNSDINGITQKNGSLESMGVEVNGGGIQISQVEHLTVYVDYSEAFTLSPDTSLQIEQTVEDYENEMGNNFSIYLIEESTTCDYVYKWTVDKNQYLLWHPTFGGAGKKGIKQMPEPEDEAAFPGPGMNPSSNSTFNPYLECF